MTSPVPHASAELSTGARLFEPSGPHDRRLAQRAEGLLRIANQAGLLTAADVHTATRVAALAEEDDEHVTLALALATHAVGSGSTCLDLSRAADPGVPLDWPEPEAWLAAVGASRLAAAGVLRVEHGLVYLARYHEQEVQVAADLEAREQLPRPAVDQAVLDAGLDRLFGSDDSDQRAAARAAAYGRTTVLTGGPGTGKTTTVARVIALLVEQAEQVPGTARPRIALTAPTAKAATRLRSAVGEATATMPAADQERVGALDASTMHKLLGWRPGSRSRFRHDRDNRLPHDVVVVDEASMVSLTLMARLLEALRPDARLLIVGDADQLAAVEAGAVLADLVAGLQQRADDGAAPVVRLTHTYRFGGAIGDLAQAIRVGDADRALAILGSGDDTVSLVGDAAALRGRLVQSAVDLRRLGLAGDGSSALGVLQQHRLLVAHRAGPYGVAAWNRHLEQWLAEETGEGIWGPTYAGRPVLITANDYANDLLNGDTGVVVRGGDGVLRAVMDTARGERTYAASRLSEVETMHAMTVHKSQGSQAKQVTMLLPEADSPLLTRELLYTGVTRAQESVTIVGTPETVRAAIERRSQRASGLALRLGVDT
jgi:exodeoxyribonuclease V alpha subunit